MYVLVDFYSRHFVGSRPQTMVFAACPSPNDPLGNGSVPRYFKVTFHSCMGIMPMLLTGTVSLDTTRHNNITRYPGWIVSRCAPHNGSPNGPLTVKIMSQSLHTSSSHACEQCLYILCPISIYLFIGQSRYSVHSLLQHVASTLTHLTNDLVWHPKLITHRESWHLQLSSDIRVWGSRTEPSIVKMHPRAALYIAIQ
jgi:hypothetical protein